MRKSSTAMLVAAAIVAAVSFTAAAEEEVGAIASAMQSGSPIEPGHFALVAQHADRYLSGTAHRTIFASVLADGVDDPANRYDELSDFFVLDIRTSTDFGKGHIAGAVNVPFALVAKPENLVLYPVDRPILVVCYTGHTASVITGILNTLGYDAWTLRFGMSSWTAQSSRKIYDPAVSQTIYGLGGPLGQ